MKRYTIIDPRGGGYELHKAGCRDLQHPSKRSYNMKDTLEAESPEAFLADWFNDEMQEMGFSSDDCRVFPCCKRGDS